MSAHVLVALAGNILQLHVRYKIPEVAMKRFLPLTLMAVAFVATSLSARAQVFIKPTGMKAVPLRVQTLSAQVEIIGAVAVTNWTLTAPLESSIPGGWSSDGTLCDFVCARPRDAKVTAFSVKGFQSDLIGRVEERAFTAPRVAFPADKNDPLLRSGLNAGNSFRATIYPVNSWNGITIRGTWVQSLTNWRLGATYRLPLLGLRGATTRLKELNVKITVRDGALPALSNNYNLPLKTQGGVRVLSLGQKNYRVLRDLSVTLKPSKTSSGIAMLVAPETSTTGGHFAFAFVANRPLSHFAVSGTGIENGTTFSPPSAHAGDVVLASGLYSGDPKNISAQLSATGYAKVPLLPIENAAAHALWATQKINVLSTNATGKRAQIISLSKKYSVVSPFTSWLAVGDEDLKIYRHVLASSQLDPLVREYWLHVGEGQEKGRRVAQLKKAVTQISQANGLNVEDELYMRLGSATSYAAWKGGDMEGKPRTQAEKRFARLLDIQQKYMTGFGFKGQKYGNSDRIYFDTGIYELRNKIMAEYRKPHPNFAQLDEWEHRFAQIYGSNNVDPRIQLWRTRIGAQEIEVQTRAAETAGDTAKLEKITYNRNVNSHQIYFTNNIGDPPIYVSAPADAREVVAIMPDGHIKTLDYNRWEKRWEGNYDVPVGTKDGDYNIHILIVNGDGTRRSYAMPFRVDTKAPTGTGRVELAPQSSPQGGQFVRLEVEHSGDVAIVTALLPWGEKVALLPSTVNSNTFFASARVPRDYAGKSIKVTYILIDRAHNTASIEAESVLSAPAP